jgi:hypothetical protein
MALFFAAAIGWILWSGLSAREPTCQGKSLTEWLEEYNLAGAMNRTGPASDAIRAMGDRSLPFLLTYLKKKDSPTKLKLFSIAEKLPFVRIPPPRLTPYRSPALLALRTLGPTAKPAIPELLKMFESPVTAREGALGLFSVGPESIPAFEQACENTNRSVRVEAASFLAILPASYNGDQEYYCVWYNFRPQSRPQAYVAKPPSSTDAAGLCSLVRNHHSAIVRRAGVEALADMRPQNTQRQMVIWTLRKARNDPDPLVGQCATKALMKVDPSVETSNGK